METQVMAPVDPAGLRDRALGALMGAFIGDALGVGPHWYYDLDQLVADYGPWIDNYTRPRPGRATWPAFPVGHPARNDAEFAG